MEVFRILKNDLPDSKTIQGRFNYWLLEWIRSDNRTDEDRSTVEHLTSAKEIRPMAWTELKDLFVVSFEVI